MKFTLSKKREEKINNRGANIPPAMEREFFERGANLNIPAYVVPIKELKRTPAPLRKPLPLRKGKGKQGIGLLLWQRRGG